MTMDVIGCKQSDRRTTLDVLGCKQRDRGRILTMDVLGCKQRDRKTTLDVLGCKQRNRGRTMTMDVLGCKQRDRGRTMTLEADGQTCMTNSRSILDIRLVLFNRTQPEERTKQLLLSWLCNVL